MNRLSTLGIGPKIATFLLPWLLVSIVLTRTIKNIFGYTCENANVLLIPGTLLMVGGLIFYIASAIILLKGLKETRLMTKGPYSICQNPLYASLIMVIIPALSLILNSWLVLTCSPVGYILFKLFIKDEYIELEKFFGEDYLKYKRETPEFFPLPYRNQTKKI
jgi:protein-S-isoprenylcysteine O-methyltransferase Ste14